MHLNEYQILAAEYRLVEAPPIERILGFQEEVGEVCGVLKRYHRDSIPYPETRGDLVKEMGDVLWYLSAVAKDWNIDLETIAQVNLLKLQDRKERNMLKGSGDNR